jgi:hypothetical protein
MMPRAKPAAAPDEKTAKKTAKASPVNGVRLPVGAHPGNTGGKKGRSGRPPMEFRKFLADLRRDPAVQRQIELTLRDRNAKHYAAALRVLVEYDEQLPANVQLSPEERALRVARLLKLAEERAAAEAAAAAGPAA